MSPKENNTGTKLNHMICVANVQLKFELYFYLKYPVHVSMVKQDIVAKEFFFQFAWKVTHGDWHCGLQGVLLVIGMHPPFHIWSNLKL
jgi:hypothetical protein